MKKLFYAFIILLIFSFQAIAAVSSGEIILKIPDPVSFKSAPLLRPENIPKPAVFTPRSVLYASISGNGSFITTVEKSDEGFELWLYPSSTSESRLPVKVYSARSRIAAPALNRDGSMIAFVDTRNDVKGDICVVKASDNAIASCITGNESADENPVFTSDGLEIIFQKQIPGDGKSSLFRINPSTKVSSRLPIDIDAAFPALSSISGKIAFVSRNEDRYGDIWLYEPDKGVRKLTSSSDQDTYPSWSDDSHILFTRMEITSKSDKKPASIWMINLNSSSSSYAGTPPLTSGRENFVAPFSSGNKLFFIRAVPSGGILSYLPLDGEIPKYRSIYEQMSVAKKIAQRQPLDPNLTRLSLEAVLSSEEAPTKTGAEASILLGRFFMKTGENSKGRDLFSMAEKRYSAFATEASIAASFKVLTETEIKLSSEHDTVKAYLIMDFAASEIESSAAGKGRDAECASLIAQGILLNDYAVSASERAKAIDLFEKALKVGNSRGLKAEAGYLLGIALTAIGAQEKGISTLIDTAKNFEDQEYFSNASIQALLDGLSVNGDKIAPLAALAERERESFPRLAAWSWNRIGDIQQKNGESAKAKDAYRTVLEKFKPLSSATAAARFALAELLYLEERFGEAIALYESEMGEHPEESYIYLLARNAYMKKSWSAAEQLFRNGEISAARSMFYDLLTYDGRYLEAHRGYIKSLAAQGEEVASSFAYRELLSRYPHDPVALYAAGLAETYLAGKEHLLEADRLIALSAEKMPESEYPQQTRGYIAEVLETVYGERDGIERSINFYRRALFLNSGIDNRENRANLELNAGNGAWLLGSSATAWRHYKNRFESGVPFDNPDTELLFYRRYSQAAFQMGEKRAPIEGYKKSLKLIEERIRPSRALELFGKFSRRVVERLFEATAKKTDSFLDEQLAINDELSKLSDKIPSSLPDPSWERAKKETVNLIEREKLVIAGSSQWNPEAFSKHRSELAGMQKRVDEALNEPDKLLETKSEIHDRLGLALLEADLFSESAAEFLKAYNLNNQIGKFENLALNKRSESLARYRNVTKLSGYAKVNELNEAMKGFYEVIELLDKYPVKSKKDNSKEGLISLNLSVSLDKVGGTEAAFGFSAEQERRIAQTYIARIKSDLGDTKGAGEIFTRLLSKYPVSTLSVKDQDMFGVGLLSHRNAHLENASYNRTTAADAFRRSAEIAVKAGNPVAAVTNINNYGYLLSETEGKIDFNNYLKLCADVDALVKPKREILPKAVYGRYLAESSAIMLRLLPSLPEDGSREALLYSSLERMYSASFALAGGDSPEVKAALSSLKLNIAITLVSLGEDERAATVLSQLSSDTSTPDAERFRWRALAALGRFEEGLKILDALLPSQFDLKKGEIFERFANYVENISMKDPEKGFALVEKLSEIERVHLTGGRMYAFEDKSLKEKLIDIIPHFNELEKAKGLNGADPSSRDYMDTRIKQENVAIDYVVGKNREFLPEVYNVLGESFLKSASFSAGYSAGIVALKNNAAMELAAVKNKCSKNELPQICSVLLPYPVEAVDIIETFPSSKPLRFVSLGDGRYLLFTFGGSNGIAASLENSDSILSKINLETLLIGEDISLLMESKAKHLAVSGSQLIRGISSRRPFRINIIDPSGLWGNYAGYSNLTDNIWVENIPSAHTIVIPAFAGMLQRPPSNSGETVVKEPEIMDGKGGRFNFSKFSSSRSLSLLVAPITDSQLIYEAVQLATFSGVSSVLAGGTSPLPQEFTSAYREKSLGEASNQLSGGWKLFGDAGVDSKEAAKLAVSRFKQLGAAGVKRYNEGAYREASAIFEDTINIASSSKELSKNLSTLHKYAREACFKSGDYNKSLFHAVSVLKIVSKEKPYTSDHADALLKTGILQGKVEKYSEASDSLKEALSVYRDLGMKKEEASVLSDFGNIMESGVNYTSAGALFTESAGVQASLGNERLLADQYRNIGRINDMRLSRYMQAVEYYSKARAIYSRLGDRLSEGETAVEEGRCRRLLGDFDAAEKLYIAAEEIFKGKDIKNFYRARLERGNNRWYQAKYQEAFDFRDEVEKRARAEKWEPEIVMAKNSGGLIWWTLGDNRRALTELENALEKAEKLEGRKDEIATTLNNIGLVQRESGEYDKALVTLEKALQIDRSIGSKWGMGYDLRNIGQTCLKKGDPQKGIDILKQASLIVEDIGDAVNISKVNLSLGDAEFMLKNLNVAADSYHKALKAAESMGLKEVKWRSLFGLGRVSEAKGDQSEAVKSYTEGINTVEGMRAEIRLDQLKDGFLSDKTDIYRSLVSLLARQGKSDEAFSVSERSRARSLIDLLGRQKISLSSELSRDLYEKQIKLKERIEEQESLLLQASKDRRDEYIKVIERLQGEYQDILIEIERRRPDLLSLVTVKPLEIKSLIPLIEKDVTILSYYQLEDRLLCWLITSDKSQLFSLPVTEKYLSEKISQYRRMLQNLEPLEKASKELYDNIIAPVLKEVPSDTLLGIIPNGSLHYLSFATLSDGRDYLVDRHPLFYLQAASLLKHSLSKRVNEKNRKVLAIGNPDLGDSSLSLPFAEREASTIKWNYPEMTLLTKERATESWIKENISRFGIIHLASHGEFDPVNPLFSAVRLAKDEKADGKLQADEIFGLDIKADLVVLSACQTGLGDVKKGDDVIGMNRAFIFAGTHSLVSSLWRVSDVSTAILMKQFYREYTRSEKSASLRKAMLHVKSSYPHPGYWGAFTLSGDYR